MSCEDLLLDKDMAKDAYDEKAQQVSGLLAENQTFQDAINANLALLPGAISEQVSAYATWKDAERLWQEAGCDEEAPS